MMRLRGRNTPDVVVVLVLVAIWLLFFWRLFTPIEADQASIKKGDFSGQFVAFGAYQYQRFLSGEVPLWNPYNNGGLPFIGDTQAAVFYPPRLVTIGLSKLAGGWSYHALELEMTLHVLVCSLFMYGLVRRMTLGQVGSKLGAFIAAVIFSYGGFMQSYPPLQLALLEAAIWLPLAVLGIHEATRGNQLKWSWLLLTGFAYGMSWMAGHPQTSWFMTYLLTGYLIYRGYQQHYRWQAILGGVLLFGILGGGMAAVQLLPGLEYLSHTARTGLGFDAKGNGFPIQDVIQFIFPSIMSQWSPLYVGLIGLILACIALWRRIPMSLFWGAVTLLALGLSFGKNSPFYALLYNIMPGLRFFRGQERGAFLIAFSLATLAGMGAAHIVGWEKLQDFKATRRIQQAIVGIVVLCGVALVLIFVAWVGNHDAYGSTIQPMAFTLLMSVLTLATVSWVLNDPQNKAKQVLITGLLILDLFTLSMDSHFNYDSIPPQNQLSFNPPEMVATALADHEEPFRVDGYRVLNDNYGSLYDLADMRGISPLFLEGPNSLISGDLINPRAWELFAVKYVYTDWEQMPIASEIIANGEDRYGKVNMHRLSDPRPFANLVYETRIVANEAEARSLLNDNSINFRRAVILEQQPTISVTGDPASSTATVTDFKPEALKIAVNTATNAILSVALPYYPGWVARLDSSNIPILRAYGMLSAVEVPSGNHTVTFTYEPLSYKIGALISLLTWGAFIIFGCISIYRRKANV